MDILVVVDMQNDFIDGSLGTKEALSIVPSVVEKIKGFNGLVLATKDTHYDDYLNTAEGKKLPVKHCIYGTNGWEIRKEVALLIKEEPVNKLTFGSAELGKRIMELDKEYGVENVTLIGLCTDICVISNAMVIKAFLPEVNIIVDRSCCAGVTPESHLRALEAMQACQVEII